MKRIAAVLLMIAISLSVCGCNRQLMWRHQMTTLPETSTTTPTKPPQIVEELSPGKANIKGCTVEINHVFFTHAGKNNVTYKACTVTVLVTNRSGKPVKFNSLCQIRVKQNGKICSYIDSPQGYDFDLDEPIDVFGTFILFYKVSSFDKPVQVELVHQGDVITKFTYEK